MLTVSCKFSCMHLALRENSQCCHYWLDIMRTVALRVFNSFLNLEVELILSQTASRFGELYILRPRFLEYIKFFLTLK